MTTFCRILAGLLAASLLLGLPGCDSTGGNGENGNSGGGDDPVVPAAPSGLEATPGDGEVSLSWEAADDAQTYKVYRDTESGVDVSGSPLAEGISETSYTDDTAENGTTYFYVVTGMADEEGDPSGEVQATPESETVTPASPSGLEATSGDGEVSLSWGAADDAQTYNVYRDTESGVDASGSPLAEGIEQNGYTDQAAENGTTYYYVVTGVAGEEGDPSGEAEGAPFAPASGLESTSGDSRVELSWEAAAGADAYNVYRDTESGTGASGSPLAEDVGETAFADETAENGTEYFYVVTSVNPNGEESAESEEAGGAPFAQPTGLEGTSGDSQIELSWEAAAGAETYNVYRSTESGVDASGSPLEENVSETAYTDESAENGTTYYYVVTSVNPNDQESSSAEEIEKTPFSEPPGSPGPPGPPGGS